RRRPSNCGAARMSIRILVVDDNELNVKLLTVELACHYYVVARLPTGSRRWRRSRSNGRHRLFDVIMPGVDGFDTYRRTKADPVLARIPVVMVTASSVVADKVKGLEAGADDFLIRP